VTKQFEKSLADSEQTVWKFIDRERTNSLENQWSTVVNSLVNHWSRVNTQFGNLLAESEQTVWKCAQGISRHI
jgi:hypothetical protein